MPYTLELLALCLLALLPVYLLTISKPSTKADPTAKLSGAQSNQGHSLQFETTLIYSPRTIKERNQ
jgi:cytochrome c biogenesis protein CcdA